MNVPRRTCAKIVIPGHVPLGVRGNLVGTIFKNLPEGVGNTRSVAEADNDIFSKTIVVLLVDLLGIVQSTTARVTDLELGQMVLTAGVRIANEPIGGVAIYDVKIRDVALLLADAQLRGALEGLVKWFEGGILVKQLEVGVGGIRVRDTSCADRRITAKRRTNAKGEYMLA